VSDRRDPTPTAERRTDAPTLDTARYLYCLVDLADTDAAELEVAGIDDASVYVVAAGDVGAVVHRCTQLYDDPSTDRLRRRLLTHHHVVDQAGERYGTPIPLRFHTIVEGDDGAVASWVRERRGRLSNVLADLDGRWEYRIRIDWEQQALTEDVDDDHLTDLERRLDQAGAGKRHLLQKEYEREHAAALADRKETLLSALEESIAPHAAEVERSGATGSASLVDAEERDAAAQLVVLSGSDGASQIGDRLEEFLQRAPADVRFTGPWAPYSFAPELGDR
jgi:hypothetical protein